MLRKNTSTQKSLLARRLRIAIVAARYNPELMESLLGHCLAGLKKSRVQKIRVVRVPGSYEIPMVAASLAKSHSWDAVIALGIILQGKTSHAEHIAVASSINLQRISVETGVPVIHQVLTPRNLRDARLRIKIRGIEAAHVAVEMAALMRGFGKSRKGRG